jgi:hypothetical protein
VRNIKNKSDGDPTCLLGSLLRLAPKAFLRLSPAEFIDEFTTEFFSWFSSSVCGAALPFCERLFSLSKAVTGGCQKSPDCHRLPRIKPD